MKLNNKGFSLIEILAVIVILGIVSTIGIVSVTRLIDNSRKQYYESQQKNLVLAARAYASDHKEVLPRNIGEKKKIELKTLYEKNYIKDEILDKNKGRCYPENKYDDEGNLIEKASYVNIVKTSQTEYSYKGYLYCESCGVDGNCEEETGANKEKGPLVTIEFPKNKGNELFEKTSTIDLEYLANGDNALVSSYSYKIYVDGKLVFNSGIKRNGRRPTINVHEPIYKYLPGEIKVVATITNSEGETKSYSKKQDYTDAQYPSCGMVKYDMNNIMKEYDSDNISNINCGTKNYPWINIGSATYTRHVWVVCNDFKGIGCSQPEFSKVLETDGEKDEVVIKDNNNNKQEGKEPKCIVMKCIDRTTPKITVNIKSGTTVKKTYKVEGQRINKNYTKSDKYNTWLNLKDYPKGVTMEVIVEEPTSKIKSFKWYQNVKNKKENNEGNATEEVKVLTTFKDTDYDNKEKGILKPQKQTITDDGVRKEVITIEDKAGNKITYTLILKIDRTPPPKPTITMYLENSSTAKSTGTKYTNNTWKNKYVWVNTNKPKDNPDISGWKTNQYITTGKHGVNNDKVGNDVHINNEGTSTIKFRSMDNAGNYSDYTDSKTIKLDRTIKIPVTHLKKWKNNNTTPSSSKGLSNYSNNTWLSGKVFTYPTGSEETGDVSGLKEYQYTTSGKTSNVSNKKASYRNIEEQGTSYIKWRAVDKAGNVSYYTSNSIIKLDRNAPKVPTTNMKKWKNNNTEPTSASGLSNYSNNTWYSGKVYTYPSGSNEKGDVSGLKKYIYTTTGVTSNKSDKSAKSRNVEAEGISYIKWKACDNAGNCSSYNSKSTIKLDRTNPVAKYSISGNKKGSGYANGAVIKRSCTDPGKHASGFNSTPNNITLSGGGTKNYGFTCKDKAGNTDIITGSYTYSSNSVCGTYKCNPYNCNPYNCNCKTEKERHFSCYSSNQSGKNCYRSSDPMGTCKWECVWYTNKTTCSTCYHTCYQTCNYKCWH